MAFILEGPYPALATSTFLPNPVPGDSLSNTGSLEIKQSMNGTKYSYVKSRASRKKLLWTFQISQHKALEIREFFNAYNAEKIKVTDHFGDIYIGNFTSNPFEFEAIRKSSSSPGGSLHQIQIEFEGFQQ